MKLQLTDPTVKNLKTEGYCYDTLLPGFGVRVGKRSKTFIVVRNGERNTLGHYPQMSLASARAEARKHLLNDQDTHRVDVTVKDALDGYFSSLTVRPRTVRDYTRLLNKHLVQNLGARKLGDILPVDVLKITDKLKDTPAEARHAFAAMNTFFAWCVPRHISQSPMAALKPPSQPQHRTRILSEAELKKVWDATGANSFGSLVSICILTAMRRGEVQKMQPSWVQGDYIVIPKEASKNRREHHLPITDLVRPHLARIPLTSFSWTREKNKLDAASGVNDYVIHDLRRTAASIMAAPPISAEPHLIERVLNHITGSGTALSHVYNRHKYFAEMKDVMTRYHAHLRTVLKLTT